MLTGKFPLTSNSLKFFFFTLFLATPLFTFAQTNLNNLLGKYEFAGVSTQETQNNFSDVTTQPEHATFSPFSRSVVQWWRGDNVYNSREWGKDSTESAYIEFTVTAKPGFRLNLSKLTYFNSRTTTGPQKARITHNASGTFNTELLQYSLPDTAMAKTIEWDFTDIITPIGGSVTFRLYGWATSSYLGALRVDNVSLFGTAIPEMKINEFHYVNTTATKTGFVEVAFPKEFNQLNTISLNLYNATGNVYATYGLSVFKTMETGIFDNEKIYYLDIPTGLADGQGGMSLSSGNYVIQFLSYGGSFTALSGPAAGLKSQDVGITEDAADGAYNSLYLTTDKDTRLPAGIWAKSITTNNTKGYPNIETNAVQPVELVYFRANASATNKEVTLKWATAIEKNNDYFEIERSQQELSDFRPIATLKGKGTTQTEQLYTFTDKHPYAGTSYYRLKQTDFDGTVSYSKVLAVKSQILEQSVSIYPNPALVAINVDLGNISQVKEMQLQIINSLGRVVYQKIQLPLQNSIFTIPVTDLPAGTYYLVVIKNGQQESKRFIKL